MVEKATSVMDLRGAVTPPAGAPVISVEQMRIGVDSVGQIDCRTCTNHCVLYGVIRCASAVKCVSGDRFKGHLTPIQLWKE